MIVVDTNVLAALILPTGKSTDAAMALLECDREWAAPLLWRSEFCNLLATGVRNGWLDRDQAAGALASAEMVMEGGDFAVPAAVVLEAAVSSGCTAYACEFVVLAAELGTTLITLDRAVLRAFPEVARPLDSPGIT